MRDDFDAQWQRLADDVMSGLKDWRMRHPKATLREIEQALDARLAQMRARLMADITLASAAADITTAQAQDRPRCPTCGGPLQARGQHQRTLTTQHDQSVPLSRTYTYCPTCQVGLFPPG
jgi:hypothetical protein